MKKCCAVLLMVILLSGCGVQETFETVGDWYYEPVISPGVISLKLPDGAAAAAMNGQDGSIYLYDGCSISLQTLPSGNLSETLRNVCGFSREQLSLMETRRQGIARYDFVWAAAGEGGDQVGRAAILDDGYHHYVLSVMADAAEVSQQEAAWQEMFASFSLGTGS